MPEGFRVRDSARVSEGYRRNPCTARPRPGWVAVLALLGAGLTLGAGPAPAAAVEPYPFNDENLTLFTVPAYPASLVTAGGRGVFASLTLNGLVSEDYGLTDRTTPASSPTSCATPGPTTRSTATPAAS